AGAAAAGRAYRVGHPFPACPGGTARVAAAPMMNSIDSNRRYRLKKTLLAAATAAALAMFAAPVALAQDATRYGTWGIDTAGMDPEADPGEDFFRYVSGN